MVSASSPSARVARWAPRRARGGSTRRWERLPPRAAVAREDPSSSSSSSPRAGPSARELDAILARVAVMVSAATDMFPAKARETLAAHPELLAALARGDFDFDCDGVAETTLDEDPARDDSDSSSSDASVHVALGALVDRHVAASLAFLGDEAGVPPAALGALVAAHPTVLSASVPERLRPAWAFLRRPANRGGCGLSPREAVDAAANDPTMLTRDVATSLEPALAVLVEDVGVRPRDAAGMGMLRRDVAERASRAAAFFAVECGLGSVAAKALARRDPRVVLRDVDAAYRPTLEVMRETGMSLDDIAKVVAKAPGALAQSSPARVRRKLAFFAEAPCRLGADGAARVVAQWPTALTLSVENNLAPTHAFLASGLGLGETGVRAVLLKCPNVFGLTRATIRDKFAFLADKFLGAANAVAMVTRMPALLTISLENNLEPTAAFLIEACEEMLERDEGREDGSVDGSESVSEREAAEEKRCESESERRRRRSERVRARRRSAAAEIVAASPSLLGMSVERKLRPTLAYLRATFPSMTAATAFKSLTYSLGGNIAPRRNLLTSRGLDGRWAPSTFLAWTADAFCENVGVDRKAYDDEVARCQTAFAAEYAAKTAAGGPGARRGGEEGEEGGRPVVEGPRESRSPGGAIRSAIRARAAVPAPESAAERREARRRARTEAAARNRDRTQEGGGERAQDGGGERAPSE